MDGEPEPMKPDDKPTLLCTEEWCVACGNCDFPEGHKAQGLWKAEEVRCEACYETTDCECQECTHCGELDNEMMWCTDCEIEILCRDCWTGCGCDAGDLAYDAMKDDIGSDY